MSSNYSRYDLRVAIMVVILCLIAPFAMDGYVPSLPAMTRELHSSTHIMQLTITVYLLGAVISQLIAGPLSDRLGRRKVALIGLGVSLFGSLLCVCAISPLWLILARLVQGFGIGSSNALFRAIMRDTFTGTRMAKIASYVGTLYMVAAAIAPIIGGYIQAYFGWRENFIFILLLTAIITMLTIFFLPETHQQLNKDATRISTILRNFYTLLTSPVFVGNTLCSSFALAGVIAYFTVSPFLLQNIVGLTPVQYGWISILLPIGLILGNLINGAFIMRLGTRRMLAIGIAIMLLSGVVMLAIASAGIINTYVIVIPALFFAAAGGFVYTNAMSDAFHPFPHMAGVAGAIYGALQVLTAFFTTLLIASFHVHNQIPLAKIFILLGVAGTLIFTFMLPREK